MALGTIRSYDVEFAPREASRDLFANGLDPKSWEQIDQELGGGRSSGDTPVDLVPWLVLAALLLLPVDVALRRLMTS